MSTTAVSQAGARPTPLRTIPTRPYLLPQLPGRTGEGRSRCWALRSGSSEYISGSLSNSKALQSLSTAQSTAEDDDILFPDDVFELVEADEERGALVVDGEILDEGVLQEEEAADVTPVDYFADPMFSDLSDKTVQMLRKHMKTVKKQEAPKMDESDPTTRTTASPHKKLKIVGGTLKGRRLLSPRGRFVRPMMERVRAAIFNMLFSNVSYLRRFPPGSRWLDLYAGTGAVGLEAVSRGCEDVHFVEMDPWLVNAVLRKNIEACSCSEKSTIRTMKVEQYLDRLIQVPQYSSGPFDYLSICPPYRQVDYPALQQQIEDAGVVHEQSIIFMEYPRQLSHQIQETIGGLQKIKDRQYGRTYLAVYGPQQT